MNKLELIRTFVTIAETGSFTEAAQALNLPKASVSAAIQKLENHVGAQLLHRTTRKVTITPDGEAFLERSKDLLSEVTDIENMFLKKSENLKGRIRADFPTTISRIVLFPHLPEFLKLHPELELEIGSTDRRVDLIREGYDFVLRVGSLTDSGLVAKKIGEFKMVNCVSPGYIKKYGRPKNIEELKDHYIVHYVSTLGARPDGFEYFDGEKYVTQKMKGLITVNSVDSYQAACKVGMGIIQVPYAGIKEEIKKGFLVPVLERLKSEPMPITFVYPNRRNVPTRVKVFMDWVEDTLKDYIGD
ncbi:MAG: LysR family transcriptional regulator [Bdellovibrionota bacterium]